MSRTRQSLTLSHNRIAERIIRDTCHRFVVRRKDLLGHNRSWLICWPRFIAITLIYESIPCLQRNIGSVFDVTSQSVSNAIGSAYDLEQTSKYARSDIAIMRMRLGLVAPRNALPSPYASDASGKVSIADHQTKRALGHPRPTPPPKESLAVKFA